MRDIDRWMNAAKPITNAAAITTIENNNIRPDVPAGENSPGGSGLVTSKKVKCCAQTNNTQANAGHSDMHDPVREELCSARRPFILFEAPAFRDLAFPMAASIVTPSAL